MAITGKNEHIPAVATYVAMPYMYIKMALGKASETQIDTTYKGKGLYLVLLVKVCRA